MARTDRQTDNHTDGHGDSMTESGQWADSVKNVANLVKNHATELAYTHEFELRVMPQLQQSTHLGAFSDWLQY